MNGRPHDLALWRHYEAAAEAAALLLALARCRLTDREPLFALASRQRLRMLDLLHEFAYNARRAIELAEEHASGTIAHAQGLSVRPYNRSEVQLELEEDVRTLTGQSLWWVLGRIIHSRALDVHCLEEPEMNTEWTTGLNITEYQTPVAFSVRSDHDGPDETHFVLFDALLESYTAMRSGLAKAIQALGAPADEHGLYM